MEPAFEKVAIVGVGLIGGSLGLAWRRLERKPHILGIGRNLERLNLALRKGAIDSCSPTVADVAGCDLVILAMPIENILDALDELGGYLSPGCIVTDVGSTKRRICARAWSRLPESAEFVGGHPVAGREVAGVEHSLPGLFRGAPYILCPRPGPESPGVARLRPVLEEIGARTSLMTPDEHDRALAWISHLPQLISTALAAGSTERPTEVSGSGFRDMTRLAGSPYSVWSSILDTNADFVDDALADYIRRLEGIRTRLRAGSLRGDFETAAGVYRHTRTER